MAYTVNIETKQKGVILMQTNADSINKSIDNILLSIESNNRTIDDMLTTAKENNSRISDTMQHYAVSHSCLTKEQMRAYAEYAREFDCVKKLYAFKGSAQGYQSFNKIHNEELAYSMLDEVHTEQLGFMERLCSVLEKAAQALKLLCTD